MASSKYHKKSFLSSALITIFVVAMLVTSGPASAVSVLISGLQTTPYTQGSKVEFQVKINITDPDKFVPITNISINVTGPSDIKGTFALDGTQLSGDTIISIDPFLIPHPSDFGYGYGYGYDSRLGRGYNFGYGYGYGYGYGAGGGPLTYIYNVTIDSTSLTAGNYNMVASLNTGAVNKPSFDSETATFEIATPALFIIPADVRIEPETLNLARNGEFTAFIKLPLPYNVTNINPSTVVSEGAHVKDWNIETDIFIAKFDTQDLVNIAPGNKVKFTVKGNLTDGTPFEGNDTIRVISQDGGSGSGSSGSGGGVVTSEPYDNILKAETIEKSLIADTPVAYKYTVPELSVYEVDVTGRENENYISLRIEALKGTSKLVAAPAPGTVYRNVNIWAGTKRIKEALIKLKLEKSWLDSNGFTGSDIVLVKWDGTKWIKLDTSQSSEDDSYIYLEAKSDTFSIFAITGLKGGILPTATVTSPGGTTGGETTTTGGETITATPVPTTTPKEAQPVNLTAIALVIAVLTLAVVVYIKRKEIFKK